MDEFEHNRKINEGVLPDITGSDNYRYVNGLVNRGFSEDSVAGCYRINREV